MTMRRFFYGLACGIVLSSLAVLLEGHFKKTCGPDCQYVNAKLTVYAKEHPKEWAAWQASLK